MILNREWVVQQFVICMSTHFFPYFLNVSPIMSVDNYIKFCVFWYIKHRSGGRSEPRPIWLK